jgi:hypothetical protein
VLRGEVLKDLNYTNHLSILIAYLEEWAYNNLKSEEQKDFEASAGLTLRHRHAAQHLLPESSLQSVRCEADRLELISTTSSA